MIYGGLIMLMQLFQILNEVVYALCIEELFPA